MSRRNSHHARSPPVSGFTLVELAVTLLIVTLLVGGILVPLQAQVESRKAEETQRILDNAREALLAYAAGHGRLPCPADAASNGLEPTAGVNPANGDCPSFHGFLPAALLGFTPVDASGYAVDGWGPSATNRIRYAVSPHLTQVFTTTGGIAASGIGPVASNYDLVYICGSADGVTAGTNCGTAQRLASNVVAVIWSLGPNAVRGGVTPDEAENVNNDRVFVSRVRSTSGPAEFDDQLTWISGLLLVSRLVASGQLP